MILGVDTGTRTCGWARFDPRARRFDALGALEMLRNRGKGKTEDNEDRGATIADRIAIEGRGCSLVVIERMSFPPGGQIPIALGFGVVMGVARALIPRPTVCTVRPQDWQRAVLPDSGPRVDYDELAQVVAGYVRRDPASAQQLDALEPRKRTHALDACALALLGWLQPMACRVVGDVGMRDVGNLNTSGQAKKFRGERTAPGQAPPKIESEKFQGTRGRPRRRASCPSP